MGVKASLIEIDEKKIEFDKSLGIYRNGEDNAYSERMERYKNNSVTASMASKIMRQYIVGKGFGEADNLQIGNSKLSEVALDIATDIVDNCGVFIHVNYDGNFDVSDFSVIPFNQCRIGKKDSKEYNGKILVYNDWTGKIDKNKIRTIDVFNPDKKIIENQVNKAGGLNKYQGQVLFVNMDRQFYYPFARINGVYLECDNEYLASVYKNTLLRDGFFGKQIAVTRPLIDDSFIEEAKTGSAEAIHALREAESERKQFKDTIQKFTGVHNNGGILHLEVDYKGDALEDAILFKNIESKIDDKLFSFTENSSLIKILMAYNNLPVNLVKASEAVFSDSGKSLITSKETYWENTSVERSLFERIVNDLMRRKNDYVYTECLSVKPLITPQVQNAIN